MSKKKLVIALVIGVVVIASIIVATVNKSSTVTCLNENTEYILGGEAVGIKLLANGVLVMGVDRTDVDIKIGDIILEVNGEKIETNSQLEEYVLKGEELTLKILRDNKEKTLKISPNLNRNSNEYRLGLWVKDSSAGVGTITFYEKDSMKFAALGHAITETSNNQILPITTGGITKTEIFQIKKGVAKNPGELKGTMTNDTLGQIYLNTSNGIFGYIENEEYFKDNKVIQLGNKEEIKEGEAYIYVTLEDNIKEKYKIEIERIYLNSKDNKNIAFRVSDERLLSLTGGIVQGMSGAPIVQNGKLIGCITHVLLDDPTMGYGAFIENMIKDINDIEK